jgi:hypothetical protein
MIPHIPRDQYFTVKSQVQLAALAARKRCSEDGLAKADRRAWRRIFLALRASVFCGYPGVLSLVPVSRGFHFYHDRNFDDSISPLQWNQTGLKPLATST